MHASRAGVLAGLLFVAGCETAAPGPPSPPRWSDSEPYVEPTHPVERNVGRVVIHTPRLDAPTIKGAADPGARFRGYRLYDEHGNLVKDCPGHRDTDDSLTLEAGRYLVYAVFERSVFDERGRTIQFVVAKGETTFVDMTRPPETVPAR